MPEYLVTWEIDIEADSPEEAAKRALLIQRDQGSEATIFNVTEENSDKTQIIDGCEF